MHVVRQLDLQLTGRAERFAVDELHLQYLVRWLVDGVVVWASPLRQRLLYAEGIEHLVYLRAVEPGAPVRVEHLDVGYRELERRECRPHQVGILARPRGMPHYLAVVKIDQQADVVSASADAHVGQVAAYVGARRAAAEAPRHHVRHVGLVGPAAMALGSFASVGADQAVFPYCPADAPVAGGYAGPRQRGLYLARAVAAVAGLMRCGHVALDGIGRFRTLGAEAHRVAGGTCNARIAPIPGSGRR